MVNSCSETAVDRSTIPKLNKKAVPMLVFDSFLLINPSTVEKAAEVNEQLQRLLNEMRGHKDDLILAFDPSSLPYITEELKELQRLLAVIGEEVDVPAHFRCPISLEIMGDPVVLSSGVTYDRPYIQSWLDEGHKTCPHTQQLLSHSFLIPNCLVLKMILQWCKGIETATHVDELMSSGPMHEQKMLIKEFQRLIKQAPTVKRLNKEVIHQLLSLLLDAYDCHHPDVQKDVVAIILNLSLHDNKFREMVGEHPSVIPLLVDALREGSLDARKHAAAAISALSAIKSNNLKLGECGAMEALVSSLEDKAIPNHHIFFALNKICNIDRNRSRAATNGVLSVMLNAIRDEKYMDEIMFLLAMLAHSLEAIHELGRLGAVSCLLGIANSGTWDLQQRAATILRLICKKDQTWLRDIKEEEETNGTFSKIAKHIYLPSQIEANSILEMLKLCDPDDGFIVPIYGRDIFKDQSRSLMSITLVHVMIDLFNTLFILQGHELVEES